MADFKLVGYAAMDAASNTSLTSAIKIAPELTHYMIRIPPAAFNATTCTVSILGAETSTATYLPLCYSNNPATSTSSGISYWEAPATAAVSGALVICEGAQFVPGWMKFKFSSTATANTGIQVWAHKFD